MKVLAAYNIKGGVGKTTSAVNLAYLSARSGARTLVWDLDPQGAASFYFRIKPKIKGGGKRLFRRGRDLEPLIRGTDFDRLDLLPSDFSFRKVDLFLSRTRNPSRTISRLLRPLRKSYDYLVLDCAPGISLVSESIFVAADALLIPTLPTTLSLRTLEQVRRTLEGMKAKQRPTLLPFFSMVDMRRALHREICKSEDEALGGFLDTRIPANSSVERMGLQRAPLPSYAPKSPAAQAYESLWDEVRKRL